MEKIPNKSCKNLWKVSIKSIEKYSTVTLHGRICINIPTWISIKISQLKERYLNRHFHRKTTGFFEIASKSKILRGVFGNLTSCQRRRSSNEVITGKVSDTKMFDRNLNINYCFKITRTKNSSKLTLKNRTFVFHVLVPLLKALNS